MDPIQYRVNQILTSRFDELVRRNSRFSVRGYARMLGVSAGAMSELLNGKRPATRRVVEKIVDKLRVGSDVAAELLAAFPPEGKPRAKRPPVERPETRQVSEDEFQLISSWIHLAILSLMKTEGFQSSPDWIAERLGVSKREVVEGLERLERIGLISIAEDGSLRRQEASLQTSDDFRSLAVCQAHSDGLRVADRTLWSVGVDARDFTSTVMAIDVSQLTQAKRRIRKFHQDMERLLEKGKRTEVYRVSVQLFPLSAGNPGTITPIGRPNNLES